MNGVFIGIFPSFYILFFLVEITKSIFSMMSYEHMVPDVKGKELKILSFYHEMEKNKLSSLQYVDV
jgi:hypothetical protein